MMNTLQGLLWIACLWALGSPSVNAEDGTTVSWGGCEDPVKGAQKVTIGDKTTICLTISDGSNWSESRQYIRLNFQPIADEYSRFVVPNCTFVFVDAGSSGMAPASSVLGLFFEYMVYALCLDSYNLFL